MCDSGLCLIYKYPIYFDQGYKYLLKTRTDFGRKVFGLIILVFIREYWSLKLNFVIGRYWVQISFQVRVKCNIIVVKRHMFLHQAYDNGSKSHWSFGWEVETAVGFGTIKKTPPCLIAMSVPSLDPNSEHLPGNGDVSVRVKVSQGDGEQSVSQFVHIP